MAFVTGGKHFGQYTYEHWYDREHEDKTPDKEDKKKEMPKLNEEGAIDKKLTETSEQ